MPPRYPIRMFRKKVSEEQTRPTEENVNKKATTIGTKTGSEPTYFQNLAIVAGTAMDNQDLPGYGVGYPQRRLSSERPHARGTALEGSKSPLHHSRRADFSRILGEMIGQRRRGRHRIPPRKFATPNLCLRPHARARALSTELNLREKQSNSHQGLQSVRVLAISAQRSLRRGLRQDKAT